MLWAQQASSTHSPCSSTLLTHLRDLDRCRHHYRCSLSLSLCAAVTHTRAAFLGREVKRCDVSLSHIIKVFTIRDLHTVDKVWVYSEVQVTHRCSFIEQNSSMKSSFSYICQGRLDYSSSKFRMIISLLMHTGVMRCNRSAIHTCHVRKKNKLVLWLLWNSKQWSNSKWLKYLLPVTSKQLS